MKSFNIFQVGEFSIDQNLIFKLFYKEYFELTFV